MKPNRLMAILILTVVAAAPAGAQAFQCTANAGVPPLLRSEDLAGLAGDLLLNCTGGTPTAAGVNVPRVNIQIFLNTNVTSRLLADPASEALLMIDEPAPASQNPCTSLDGCSITGVGGSGVNYGGGAVPNIYQGRQIGANSVVWFGVPLDPPGVTTTRIIRIKNVRANANQLGVSPGLVPTQIIEFIAVTGEISIPINQPQQIVGFVATGLSVSLRTPDGAGTLPSTGRAFTQCSNTGGAVSFRIRFSEGFATAFRRRNHAVTSPFNPDISPPPIPQASPQGIDSTGMLYNTETGFYNPALPATNNLNKAGLADHGARLRAAFSSVPAGVSLFVTLYEVASTAGNRVRLVSTDSSGAGAFSPVAATGSSDQGPIAPVSLSGGAGVAVWEVMNSDPLSIGRAEVGVVVAYASAAVGTAMVSGMYGPTSAAGAADSSSALPRFAGVSSPQAAFTTPTCLSVTPPAVSLTYRMLSPAFSPPPLVVSSNGPPISFTASTTASWLEVSPTSGITPATLNILLKPSGFGQGANRGTRSAAVAVSSASAANSPLMVKVTLSPRGPASLSSPRQRNR